MIKYKFLCLALLALGCQRTNTVTHVMSLNGSPSVDITCEQGFTQCLQDLRRECSSSYKILFIGPQGAHNLTVTALCKRDDQIH